LRIVYVKSNFKRWHLTSRLLIFLTISLPTVLFSQDRSKSTQLDFLNQYPFIPQDNITGICFVTLADTFDYYKKPIVIKDRSNFEILRIEINDSVGLTTTYNGAKYHFSDTLNTFNPWLWIPNPEYFRLAFQCTDTTGEYFKVWLTDKEFTFIRKDNQDLKKQSIADFVLDWTSMGFDFDRSSNPLRQTPINSGKIINMSAKTNIKFGKERQLK
jgi:hypothetical protein